MKEVYSNKKKFFTTEFIANRISLKGTNPIVLVLEPENDEAYFLRIREGNRSKLKLAWLTKCKDMLRPNKGIVDDNVKCFFDEDDPKSDPLKTTEEYLEDLISKGYKIVVCDRESEAFKYLSDLYSDWN